MSGFKIQNVVNNGLCSQLRLNGWLSSISWKYWGHFDIGPCGCRRGIQSLCITLSQCPMTCLITWMAWCEHWPRKRLNGRKTCSSLWSELDRGCPNTMLKCLQWCACFVFPHILLIFSASCNHLERGTKAWILILRMRHLTLHNTWRRFWSMWRMNTLLNIDACRSINPKPYRVAISSFLQLLKGPMNHPLMPMIRPAMMRNPWHLTMSMRWYPDNAILQPASWTPPCSIGIRHQKHQTTGGNSIQISLITTLT